MGARSVDRRETDQYRAAVERLSEAVDHYDEVARSAGATEAHVLAGVAKGHSLARTSFVLLCAPYGEDDAVLIEEAGNALERMVMVREVWGRYVQEVSRDHGRR